jgi:sigma-B regulation protein RsbU (phosphoserine phosphatase)
MLKWLPCRMSFRLQPVTGMKAFTGLTLLQFQLVFLGMGLAFTGIYWVIRGPVNILQPLFFDFFAGNCALLVLKTTAAAFSRQPGVRAWVAYLAIVIPASVAASVFASSVWNVLSGHGLYIEWVDVRTCAVVMLIGSITIHLSRRGRARLEDRNRELESQVTMGQLELRTQETELRAAHEIQTHLLPREIPQVKGFEVSCAWEPALSIGGDYFDVLALNPGEIAVCLADVSGKGIAAALLMANLQATVRAFAPGISGPGALCRKINEVLCASIAPGKFVTLFYGSIDRATMMLRYENAGHVPPVVLRGDSAITLSDGGTVLGLFPEAQYEERSFPLESGDCLLLMTDGVTEAANEADEEFGAERVTASARAARTLGAHGIRTRILDDVTRFCSGNFHDDASLIVVTVD